MINIRKYNESWQNDRFTAKDLQIIENIFLDWGDRKCVFYKAVIGHRGEGPLTNVAAVFTVSDKSLIYPVIDVFLQLFQGYFPNNIASLTSSQSQLRHEYPWAL